MRFAIVFALSLLLIPMALLAQVPSAVPAHDLDSDGLDDALEQQLLEKFRPVFMLSGTECDVAPAEFFPAKTAPSPTLGTAPNPATTKCIRRLTLHVQR